MQSLSFSYLGDDGEPHDAAHFKSFGSIKQKISGYVKLFNSVGVTARYIRWDFDVRRPHAHTSNTACTQLAGVPHRPPACCRARLAVCDTVLHGMC